eukprot:484898-Ditylum_brightwellii.AAC.1
MSFGWKICTSNGEIIAEHAGPAFRQASSFRAKGYGVFISTQLFLPCNGVYSINKAIDRPT